MADDPIAPLERQLADAIRHGRIARFSVERLIRILATVDRQVHLTVVASTRRPILWHWRPPRRRA